MADVNDAPADRPRIVSRDEWSSERKALLRREKMLSRQLDELAQARQQMPWVRLEKDYAFTTADGEKNLGDLFGPFSQLIVYHLMFGPDWDKPCPGCTAWANAFNGTVDQIESHDATLVAVSRTSLANIERIRQAKGWSFVWASSLGSDFNFDFHASSKTAEAPTEVGDEIVFFDRGENHGISVFAKRDGEIFHTYSCYNRGIQQMNGAFGYVDLLPKGGN